MPEYRITPRLQDFPAPADLLRKLEDRGFTLEVNLHGSLEHWNTLRFYREDPAEMECSLIRDGGDLTVSTPEDSLLSSRELALELAGILLKDLGGSLEDAATKERWTAAGFLKKKQAPTGSPRRAGGLGWLLFSWGLAAAALAAYFELPSNLHLLALAVVFFAVIGAAGLTLSLAQE